jgi:hypothetical protein
VIRGKEVQKSILKFAGGNVKLSKNVKLIKNLSIIWRKRLPKYHFITPLLSGWAGS